MTNTLELLSKIEEYIISGVARDITRGSLKQKEWIELLRLARVKVDAPGMFSRYLALEDDDPMLDKIILLKDGKTDENDAGSLIPKEVLEKALEQFHGAVGLATWNSKEDKFEIFRDVGDVTEEFLSGACTGFQANDVIIYLSNQEKVEDLQPFPILGEQGKPELIGLLQGDPSCLPKVFDFLQKRRAKEETFDEFWDIIDNDKVGDKIKELIAGDGCLILLGEGGKNIIFDKNANITTTHDWGMSFAAVQASDAGQTEEVKDVKPGDEHGRPHSAFGSLSKSNTPTQPTTTASKDKQAIARPVGAALAKISAKDLKELPAELKPRIDSNGTVVFKAPYEAHAQCPRMITLANGQTRPMTREEAEAWYKENLGWKPTNWKSSDENKPNPIFPASFLRIMQPKVELKDLKGGSSAVAIAAAKDTSTKYIEPPMNWTEGDVRNFMTEYGPKIFGANSEHITNPAEMLNMEKESESIFVKTGKTPMEMLMAWTARYMLCSNAPADAARFWGHFQVLYVEMFNRNSNLETRIQELETENNALKKAPAPKSAFGSLGK